MSRRISMAQVHRALASLAAYREALHLFETKPHDKAVARLFKKIEEKQMTVHYYRQQREHDITDEENKAYKKQAMEISE